MNEENLPPKKDENYSNEKDRNDSNSNEQCYDTKSEQHFTEVKCADNADRTNNKQSSLDRVIGCENNFNDPETEVKNYTHVTVTQSDEKTGNLSISEMHNLTLKEVLEIIKEANGSQISFNAAIESACSRNQLVGAYLGDKLTSRENKKIRNLSVEIMHDKNIELVKHKPQLIFKWIENSSEADKGTSD